MTNEASTSGSPGQPKPGAVEPARSRAWQPLTFGGVACFAQASWKRLFIVQGVVAALATGTLIWFLQSTWFPATRAAILRLPESGRIERQELFSPRASAEPLVANRFLSFSVDASGRGASADVGDLRVEFHRRHLGICSLLGCFVLGYPAGRSIQFNRPELLSWWDAWEPIFYVAAGLGALLFLVASWIGLATVYCPFVRIYAFFKDRSVSLVGSWKLAAASLLAPCLLASAGIVLYRLQVIDLVGFIVLWLLHFPTAWLYLFLSPLRLVHVAAGTAEAVTNPFGPEQARSPNPFASGPDQDERRAAGGGGG